MHEAIYEALIFSHSDWRILMMKLQKFAKKILGCLPDKLYLKIQYRYLTHRKLNLDPPIRYNEKLQWIKLYDRQPVYTDLVDKYRVKQIVAERIGEKYVVPLLAVWDRPMDIDISSLPSQFVIKTNHDSKGVVICRDKAQFDLKKVKSFFEERMKVNGYSYGREWPYKNIKRKIFAEKYLEDESGGLIDYKVLCFNGVAKLIQLHQGRFTKHYTHDIYDVDWNVMPFNQVGETSSEYPAPKPPFLDEMIELAETLSANSPHVRVDWYYVNGQLYFGEMTFFDGAGYFDFVPDEYNEIIGEWIKLPLVRK